MVYVCEYSVSGFAGADFSGPFVNFGHMSLLYIMNALFPGTTIEVHTAEGSSVSDSWRVEIETFDTETETGSFFEHCYDPHGQDPRGEFLSRWKERFALELPAMKYISALIECSTADGNVELTALLLELSRKLSEGLITCENDEHDDRIIGERYAIEERDDVWERAFLVRNHEVLIKCVESEMGVVTIPDVVTCIGDGEPVFEDCYDLQSITIPASVTSIGDYAFEDCYSLTSITIPDSVTRIGSSAFYGCRSLTSIIIPASVTSIGFGAFDDCDKLTIHTPAGSYAEQYAHENGIPVEYT
ncbi:MAG: leucine-rich repeat domain-containing protein [Oscillospiraceae bacterium]|nr:leucine-rich repeat domain-containing protein [Oscillospiraceae bacterium]